MKKLPDVMKLLTDRMPRKVAIASVTMAATLIVFAVLFFVLGGAHDDTLAQNVSLKNELTQTTTKAKQSQDDRKFIADNQEKYDALIHSDRLIPHTQRVAVEQMTTLGKQDGLNGLSYSFTAASASTTAAAPVIKGGYKLQVVKVDLKVDAALDTQVYDFLLDLGENFPGSAVVEQFNLERAGDITTEQLNQVSRSRPSGLVKGEVHLTWRTAQAQEDENKGQAPAARGGK